MAHRQRRRKLQSCEGCRAAHARCDSQLPACGRCALLGVDCIRGQSVPFRYSTTFECDASGGRGDADGDADVTAPTPTRSNHGRQSQSSKAEFAFAGDQIWVTPPPGERKSHSASLSLERWRIFLQLTRAVEFVFEYVPEQAVLRDDSDASSADGASDSDSESSLSEVPTPTPPHASTATPTASPEDHGLWLPENGPEQLLEHATVPPSTSCGGNSLDVPSTAASTCLVRPNEVPLQRCWPLKHDHEAALLQHFVVNLSSWFDYGDPKNTFATSVAQSAASSPPLLNAIFAVAARHLSIKTGGQGAVMADNYHRTCLELLIPLLNDTDAALDERLYAATVILRLYEEIMGLDMENHLMGTHTFVRLQEYAQSSAIRQAVFRVVLRQEIVIAFRSQRPVQLLREYIRADRSLDQTSTADDWTRAFHSFVLCAEVLTYCYGDVPKTPQSWDDLAWRAQKWLDTLPVSYAPLLYRDPGQDGVFPTVMLLNDCHVAARQHNLLSRILLAAHDPRRPHLGPRAAEATKTTNSTIKEHVRSLCGITVSNAHCIPSMFTACIAIAICGDLFTEMREQKAMFDILVKTDLELAWPTAAIQAHLRQQWGWPCV
ncbi:Zn(2)-C6 fungal-type DNA-binding domain protein [Niveomyces insectorum RCEF 264]|uniref:Zn(2)-C6 fungal-type DNA-binding domain protein n=1 Tax=Niveomyces insectorum RCEF 264 TaxID=1081102 RepID=A0A167QFL0_9HYPO|nr:Zn(2)-C6 fungal-type DNA-binding domain protein [Niveomyces insectorum RCEF 264]